MALFTSMLFWQALAAGIGVAAFAGPLGAFVLWQRMAYFGDAIAHSAILGLALSLFLNISPTLGIFASALGMALLLAGFQRQKYFSADTVLGVLAHGMLAIGVLLVAVQRTVRIDLNAYLFGDILAVEQTDILITYSALIVTGLLLWRYWRALMLVAIHSEIAQVEGVALDKTRLLLTLMIAGAVAVSVKIVGALLITSLLILPAAAARLLSRTPTQMVMCSCLLGIIAVIGGLVFSFQLDLPSGPSIVVAGDGCVSGAISC